MPMISLVGVQSQLHQRICRFGLSSHNFDNAPLIIASTNLKALAEASLTADKQTRFAWVQLDSFKLFHSDQQSVDKATNYTKLHSRLDIFAVGNLGGLLAKYRNPFDGNTRLLYCQTSVPQLIQETSLSKMKAVFRYSYYPRHLYLLSDLIKKPSVVLSYANTKAKVVFVGQDGSITARMALKMLEYEGSSSEQEWLSNSGRLDPASLDRYIDFAVHLLNNISMLKHNCDDSVKAAQYILACSLYRLIILTRLSCESWFRPVLYPSQFLNICSWPQIGNYRVLDLGGINGSEHYYPRSVDLAVNRVPNIYVTRPVFSKYFESAASVKQETLKIIQQIKHHIS